jgi:uncharacterized protein
MNVSSLKTPGVYINEIDAFPPSIAQVATAIPAFVGYTEKGPKVPTRINSFMEFEQTFGGSPVPASVSVFLDANLLPDDSCQVTESVYKLYNSMRLFYANGGGVCYIVSIGNYSEAINSEAKFNTGLDLLKQFDEPTLLLFPDAVNLAADKLGLIHQQALKQCADLMDRFTIIDVKQKAGDGLILDSENFRNGAGNQNLKYGASYYPYLQSSFPYTFRFNDINGAVAGKVDFNSIYSADLKVKPLLDSFATLTTDIGNTTSGLTKDWSDAKTANLSVANVLTPGNVGAYATNIWNLMSVFKTPSTLTNAGLKTYLNNLIAISLRPVAQKMIDFEAKYASLSGVTYTAKYIALSPNFDAIPWRNNLAFTPSVVNLYLKLLTSNPDGPDNAADYSKIQAQLDKLYSTVVTSLDNLIVAINNYMKEEENNLTSSIPIYSAIIDKLSQTMNTVPPSGAIAGIYAQTDKTRGVWKAPANISINGILGLSADINDADQENMNIHETGKSINALRKFNGKGFLVWGGRTLAGNSNDWRYINVRRLANMIEESAKKACMQFVFEPNVSQTWVNVKGMLDNYLTTLWNDGALAGAKPSHAFFVSVGLNETMSALDVLEGRLIVKIGYAPSRPAEFIILEFKQMQQKS